MPKMPAPKPSASNLKSSALKEGQKAPNFKLASSEGGTVSLGDYAGKHVVVYFYPKDDTPGCTIEARDFTEALPKFRAKNAAVLGVSKDSVASHCKFRDKYGLTFPLLSDPDGKMIAAYGAWGEKNMYGKVSMGIVRSTVVVGPDGKVKKLFPRVKVDGHVEAVLAVLEGSAPAAKVAAKKSPAKKTPAKSKKPTNVAKPAKPAKAKKLAKKK
jgi:peroxiredoxin Q/BCP